MGGLSPYITEKTYQFSVILCMSLKQLINVKKNTNNFQSNISWGKSPIDYEARRQYGHLVSLTGCLPRQKGCDNVYIKIHCIVVLVIENCFKLRKHQPPEVILDNIRSIIDTLKGVLSKVR